jgi:glycolate oxidase FAD binding subunit
MRASVDQLAQRLSGALGPGGMPVDDGSRAAHRIDGVTPALLVSPESVEQLTAVVRLCSEEGAAMIPWGGGTAMAIGNQPRQADVVIQLGKLARVIEHDAANLTVSAECGLTLAALQSALAAKNQFAPIAAPFPDRGTLGGAISANLNGPRRSCYGGVRDLVIGIKAVLPNGELIKAGGKVVKNVAGYDMSKLFVGSLGTLGIVAEATLRVAPIAESAATLIAEGSPAQAEAFVRVIARSVLLPAAVFLRKAQSPNSWQVAVWCEGFSAGVARQLRELERLAEQNDMARRALDAAAHTALWDEFRDFPLRPNRVIYRATLPRAAVFDFLRNSGEWNPDAVVCDAVMGTIWLSFPTRPAAIQSFAGIESCARAQRGHAVLFAAPGALKTAVNVWGAAPATLSIMREIKRQFDPAELLNPGRFVGSL